MGRFEKNQENFDFGDFNTNKIINKSKQNEKKRPCSQNSTGFS